MSLVPNYSSSSESEDSDTESQQTKQPQRKNLASSLPAPKRKFFIAAPTFEDEDKDDDANLPERQTKRTKISSGLSLADLLPAPKNNKISVPVTKSTTDKAFIPHALAKTYKSKRETVKEVPIEEPKGKRKLDEEEEEEENENEEREIEDNIEIDKKPAANTFTGSFFRVGKDLKEKEEAIARKYVPKIVQPTLEPTLTVEEPPKEEELQTTAVDAYDYDSNTIHDPNAMYSADPAVYYQYQQYYEQQEQNEADNDIDDLERIVGRRARGESNIQFKSVSQADMLPSEEWRQAQTLTAVPKFNNGASMTASKMQMKKNNIMALAAHAINNQDKLDEMFAANKKTRREASNKYGF